MKKTINRKTKNLLLFVLALLMMVSVFSATAFAADKPLVPIDSIEETPDEYAEILDTISGASSSEIQSKAADEESALKENLESAISATSSPNASLLNLPTSYFNEVEANNSIETANIVDSNYVGDPEYIIEARINDYYYDMDAYQFTITSPGNLYVDGIWTGGHYGKAWEDDLLIGLYDSSQNLIAVASYYTYTDGTASRSLSAHLSAGTYTLMVLADDEFGDLYVNQDYGVLIGFVQDVSAPGVNYQSHVQNIGWQGMRSNSGISGTSGLSYRLEAMKISVQGIDGGIEYRTHVQDIGWMPWVSNGALSGTEGRALRLEAIDIRLTGNAANQYDIYYRVHAESFGWLDWAKNGGSSGTAGYGYRLEAIQIQLVPKGGAAPGATARPFVQPFGVSYQSHVQNIGWQDWKANGVPSGTSGQSLRLEGMRIKLDGINGGIEYRTHVQNIGWMNWMSDGAMSGTSGLSYRLEAINIRLTGTAASLYDIYYRVHAQNVGWMGWAKNGEASGTAGFAYRLEAIQIQLVPKGGAAPGGTANAFIQK